MSYKKTNADIMDRAIIESRRTLRQAFEEDPDFRYCYVANIAMLLHDFYNIPVPSANDMGESIVDLLFFDIRNGPPVSEQDSQFELAKGRLMEEGIF